MPEVRIRYKSARTLKALKGIAKYFDFEIENVSKEQKTKTTSSLPITYARKPDFKALAGVWKDSDMTLEQLRKKAWGNRL